MAIYVSEQSGTDNRYVDYPDDLFDKPTPDLVLNLDNPLVIEAHLQCAALEMPLSGDDAHWFGPLTTTLCETKLVRDKEGWCVKLILTSARDNQSSGFTRTQSTCLTLPVRSRLEELRRRNIQ